MLAEDETKLQDLIDIWTEYAAEDRVAFFRNLARDDAADLFLSLSAIEQAFLLQRLPQKEQKIWMRALAPDDAADVIQALDEEQQKYALELLDLPTRQEVAGLMAYKEDEAGGLMSPRFAHIRESSTAAEAITYLRRQSVGNLETIYYCYVLDASQTLKGVVSFRELFFAPDTDKISDIMETDLVTVSENTDQETVAKLMSDHDLLAIPVVDATHKIKGIVTLDDIVDVLQEEATEDMQKIGGLETLDTPYMTTPLTSLIKKRAGWLSALFLGEMLTASAMSQFEAEISKAVVLALFVPLIISSGGNSGSQASTLVIRALALREITLGDAMRVFRRELASGVLLGLILSTIGILRILTWHTLFQSYGDAYWLVAKTVALSLIAVVTWGTIAGSMLPFLLRGLKLDPASASAPFVATLVDVSGLVIYFNVARFVMGGTLL